MYKTMLTGALILTAAMAQETRRLEIHTIDGPVAAGAVAFQGTPFFFERSEMVLDGAVVKGAPYSADAVTEMTQTLADGNRIHRATKATLYRDGQGRTRREQTLGELGPMTAAGEPVQTIMISDPATGTTYMMDSRSKVAHQMPAKGELAGKLAAEVKARVEKQFVRTETAGNVAYSVRINGSKSTIDGPSNVKKESLGTQMMEGVAVDGTRTTLTIPAGQICNEKPIQVVTESWFSPLLKTTIMTKTSDPRMGETVYKLTNVKLTEPDPTLFEPPADYTVQ